jgi:hypothetical protein
MTFEEAKDILMHANKPTCPCKYPNREEFFRLAQEIKESREKNTE